MRHTGRLVGLVVLMVTAGCGTVFPTPGGQPVTVTPAAVPTESPGPTPSVVVAPGVNFARVEDPSSLAEAHDSLLTNTSFTVESTTAVRFPTSNRSGWWRVQGAFSSGGRYHVLTERNGSFFATSRPIRIDYYSDGERVTEAYVRNDSTTQNVILDGRGNEVPPGAVLTIEPTFRQELRLLLVSTTLVGVDPLATPKTDVDAYRLRVLGVDDADQLARTELASDIERVRARLIVDERGLVHRYDVAYVGTFSGEPVEVTRSVRFSELGTTGVEPPSWYVSPANRSAVAGGSTVAGERPRGPPPG